MFSGELSKIVGLLGAHYDLRGGAIFWAGFGFNGGCWLWRPVGVHTELLRQMHVASFGCHLAWTAEPGQTFVRPQVNAPLKIPQRQNREKGRIVMNLCHTLIVQTFHTLTPTNQDNS